MRIKAALAESGSLMRLALPVAGGLLLTGGLGTVETLFVGRLGPLPLAAMSLTTSVLLIPFCIIYGLLYPQSVLIGKAFGSVDPAGVAAEFRQGLKLGLVVGCAIMLVMIGLWFVLPYLGQPPEVLSIMKPYWMLSAGSLVPFALMCVLRNLLEAIERQGMALIMAVLMIGFCVPLNYGLIFGGFGWPGLGLTGCGLAVFLSPWLTFFSMMAIIRADKKFHPFTAANHTESTAAMASGAAIRRQFAEGWPVSLQYCLEGGSVAVAGLIVGQLGALPLAANQIVVNLSSTVYMLPLGISSALSIRLAQADGQGRGEARRAIGHAGFAIAVGWGVVLSLIALLFGDKVAQAFTDDPVVIAMAKPALLVLGFMQIADGLQCTAVGALRGLMDNRWPTRVSGLCYWGVALPLSWLGAVPLGYGVAGAWAGFTIGLAVAAVWLLLRFERLCAAPQKA